MNVSPKHPKNLCLTDLLQLKFGWCLLFFQHLLLIKLFLGSYIWGTLLSNIALLLKRGVASSPPLNVTFVRGIIGQFIRRDNEQKQKSGIKREKEQ